MRSASTHLLTDLPLDVRGGPWRPTPRALTLLAELLGRITDREQRAAQAGAERGREPAPEGSRA